MQCFIESASATATMEVTTINFPTIDLVNCVVQMWSSWQIHRRHSSEQASFFVDGIDPYAMSIIVGSDMQGLVLEEPVATAKCTGIPIVAYNLENYISLMQQ